MPIFLSTLLQLFNIFTTIPSALFTASTIDASQVLDRSFSSSHLGISFRYPSVMEGESPCGDVPVKGRETSRGLDFYYLQRTRGDDCGHGQEKKFLEIDARRVKDESDVQNFVHDVVSPQCSIAEQNEYTSAGDHFSRLWLADRKPTKDLLDSPCNHTVIWNSSKGVVLYTQLADKGNAYIWPSSSPIRSMTDESIDRTDPAYDSAIFASIRYL